MSEASGTNPILPNVLLENIPGPVYGKPFCKRGPSKCIPAFTTILPSFLTENKLLSLRSTTCSICAWVVEESSSIPATLVISLLNTLCWEVNVVVNSGVLPPSCTFIP